MIVMTMAITASVNASSRPFVTARASHTKLPLTENRYDQDDLSPGPQNCWRLWRSTTTWDDYRFTRSMAPTHNTNGILVAAREASGR